MEQITPEQSGFSTARLARIRPVMQRLVDQGQFAGILTMIARRGKIVHCEAVGMRDLEAGKPIEVDTIFRIYSMSKMITSAAVMMLFEEGHFRLHDPVHAYLPEFKDIQVAEKDSQGNWQLVSPVRPVSIHHLLTHTSGITYGDDAENYGDQVWREKVGPAWGILGEHALRDFTRAVAATPLHHQPGVKFHYGVSIDVLGRLVEVVGGMPFGDFLRQRIFEPLQMKDTGFFVPPEKVERFACMYGPEEENGKPVPGKLKDIDPIEESYYRYPDRMQGGGGGLVSTAPDYLRFAQMLLNEGELDGERLLGRKTVALMRMNHLPEGVYQDEDLRSHGFGLGGYVLLHPERHTANGSLGNFGWGGAANTFFWIDYAEQMVPIIMTQYQPFMPIPIEDMYKNLVYQALI
jgi:CubicO group peptidase (beta-lactamase class C family)